MHLARNTSFNPTESLLGQDALKDAVQGIPMWQFQEGFRPDLLLLVEQLDRGPAVGTARSGQGGNQEDAPSQWHRVGAMEPAPSVIGAAKGTAPVLAATDMPWR